jgi:hypothetical protein
MDNDVLIAWMQEISERVENSESNLGKKIDSGHALLHKKHDLLREEFIIHKTESDTKAKIYTRRSALIATVIALALSFAGLAYNVAKNNDNKLDSVPPQTEQVDIKIA